jgi:hypothetical protein
MEFLFRMVEPSRCPPVCQGKNVWCGIPSVKGGEAQKVFAAWLFDLGPAE